MKDIIIIGAGPGGYEAAIRGAQLGASVALIERDEVGGTCLNRGCIPTKALYKNAEVLHTMKHADTFGIELEGYTLNLEKVRNRKNQVVSDLVGGIHQLLEANGVELIKGLGRIVDNETVSVTTADGELEVKGKHIVIATGSKPIQIPIPGADHPGIFTSNEVLKLEEVPKRLLVIGGGVVGIEFATIYNEFGSEVTVLDAMPTILPFLDADISKRLAMGLKKKGIAIETKVGVKSISESGGVFTVIAEDKKGEKTFEADRILMAVGRMPNISGLGLDEACVEYDRKGIKVSERFETTLKNVYAIGDVNGKWMLAHVASHQGIEVVERIMGQIPVINQEIVPSCVFTFPEVATVGKSEADLKEAGVDYNSSKFMFAANGKALSLGESDGFVKVIEADGKIVGVHILGPHASDLIHEAAIIINKGLTVKDVAGTIHAHPTLAEAFVEATLALHGEAIHMVPKKPRNK
ncbi:MULTISPECIES: dihydrolipoyl dehydrogenase [unclassified Fusibacter]|uniref:dihydrolipoyl dehydrogenase n=1 Tax=unclassified Fusibacter TaxID=2624464 RepID=UPI001010795B|nr:MULTISPECIES: dihydrolipoyl dehydrogenase [unclassified Fusibacter]MCK8059635.1 dihydrolipoyl dehydrogenase [Fusibacter sp. A2]NPE21436.1 dihydrolipoyl dehydrogenase [Fusibacter sp. A1]RXV61848.1 dihydrolipoyl dehydrogenase [Fusibacter sp. A1]